MNSETIAALVREGELEFSASRSGGPGGQHVNKVSSKITVRLDIAHSQVFTPEEKEVLLRRLDSRLTQDGVLIIHAQDSRSQIQNKADATRKLENILMKALEKKKARKATRPSKTAVRKRIKSKKQNSEKKKWRQRPTD